VGYWSTMAKTQIPAPRTVWPTALPTPTPSGLNFLAFDGPGRAAATVEARQHSKQQIEQCEYWDKFIEDKITAGCVAPGEWTPAC
jgi:hypothetical protein